MGRSLENDSLDTDQIKDIEESIRYYVSDGMNEAFVGSSSIRSVTQLWNRLAADFVEIPDPRVLRPGCDTCKGTSVFKP